MSFGSDSPGGSPGGIGGNFHIYEGDLIGLPTSADHLIFKWNDQKCKILFSAARQGNAMSCHFSSDKIGLRKVKEAIKAFVEFIFSEYLWCELVLSKVMLRSVGKILLKLNFKELIETQQCKVFIYNR